MSGWSRNYFRCTNCSTQKIAHHSHGLCHTCYVAIRQRGKDPATYKPQRRKPKRSLHGWRKVWREKAKKVPKATKSRQNKRNYLRRKAKAAEAQGNLEEAKRLRATAEKI